MKYAGRFQNLITACIVLALVCLTVAICLAQGASQNAGLPISIGGVQSGDSATSIWSAVSMLPDILWRRAEPQAKFVNAVMFIIFLLSVLQVFKARRSIKSDAADLGAVWDTLKQLELGPMTLSEFEQLLKPGAGIAENSLVLTRCRDVWRVASSGSRSAALGLTSCQDLAEEGRGDIPGYFSTTLVLIGLFGTLWGLSQAVLPLVSVIRGLSDQSTGLSQLRDGVEGVVAHLSAAFSCTIAGVLTTICLSVLTFFLVTRPQVAFLSGFQRFTSTELLPRFRPPTNKDAADILGRVMLESSRHFASAIAAASTDLGAVVGQLRENVAGLLDRTDALGARVVAGLEDILGKVDDALGRLSSTGSALENAASSLKDEQTSVRRFVGERLDRLQTDVAAIYDKALNSLDDMDAKNTQWLDQAIAEYQRFSESTDLIVNELGRSATELGKIDKYLRNATASLVLEERNLRSATKGFEPVLAGLKSTLGDIGSEKTALVAAERQLSDITLLLQGIAGRLEDIARMGTEQPVYDMDSADISGNNGGSGNGGLVTSSATMVSGDAPDVAGGMG